MSSIQTYTGIAWGQSELEASPLNMARVVSIVANEGKFIPTRYTLDTPSSTSKDIIDTKSASLLSDAMKSESQKWIDKNILPSSLSSRIGGKTGTPMRSIRGEKILNDGWYVCFIKDPNTGQNLSIAVRLERLPDKVVSTEAVKLLKPVVLRALKECGYINY